MLLNEKQLQKWNQVFLKMFAAEEVQGSTPLKGIYWALVLGFFLAFQNWVFQPLGTLLQKQSLSYICPEYFRNCSDYFLWSAMPSGYGHQVLFAFLGVLLGLSVMSAAKELWGLAQTFLIPLFFAKSFFAFFQSTEVSIPFETYHLLPCFIFLFTKNKWTNLRWTYVLLYVLSGLVKLDEGWISGSYFSSLSAGLPFVPREWIPFFTNLVIVMELAGSWFLLSDRWKLRKYPFVFFVVFHILSIIFVGFRYPALALPFLVILYSGKSETKNFFPSSLAALVFLLVGTANVYPFLREGDHKITYEGMTFAMNMFDANRQTLSKVKVIWKDGREEERVFGTANSFDRITPYRQLFRLHNQCGDKNIQRMEWILDMAKNGAPFYRLVDEKDVCSLSYDSWKHNSWIRKDPELVGYPDYNFYYAYNIYDPGERVKPLIYPERRIHPSEIQSWLYDHSLVLSYLYAVLAVVTPLGTLLSLRKQRRLG